MAIGPVIGFVKTLIAVKNGTEKDWEIYKRLKKETRKLLIKHWRLFVTNK